MVSTSLTSFNCRSQVFKKHHLWNLGPGCHAGRLEEFLIPDWPCRPGEDVMTLFSHITLASMERRGKIPKKRGTSRFWQGGMLGIPTRNRENGFLKQTCRTNLFSAVRHIL